MGFFDDDFPLYGIAPLSVGRSHGKLLDAGGFFPDGSKKEGVFQGRTNAACHSSPLICDPFFYISKLELLFFH
jgi:hypothetical protein